jgi:hypothetical protein
MNPKLIIIISIVLLILIDLAVTLHYSEDRRCTQVDTPGYHKQVCE